MSQIFYSPVSTQLREELDARARAGSSSRTNEDLNFMLGKISSAEAIPYIQSKEILNLSEMSKDDKKAKQIQEGIIGGLTVRSGRFLPSGPNGFLRDQTIKREIYTIDLQNAADDQFGGKTAESIQDKSPSETITNKSKRTSTYIESLEITYGDHSMGLLNTATMNIRIPNPGADLEYIESVWFRPGRRAELIIESPKSSIITGATTKLQYSGSDVIDSAEPTNQTQPPPPAQFMNRVLFDGILVSFDFSYNADTSVSATLSFRGTSHIVADLALIRTKTEEAAAASTAENTESDEKKKETITFYNSVEKDINRKLAVALFKTIKGTTVNVSQPAAGTTNTETPESPQTVPVFTPTM